MSGNWFDYQADKVLPKPSHRRPAPTSEKVNKMGLNERVIKAARPSCESIIVEESDASASMIQRIIGKIRG